MCDSCLENVLGEGLVGPWHATQSRAEVADGILAPQVIPRQSELSFKEWVELRKV